MKISASILLVLPLLFAVGCARDDEWFPLKEGQSWTYRVRTPRYEYVEDVKVKGRAPVGSQNGYVLVSQLGQSNLAWSGGTLWTTRVGHTIFVQPVPLFDANVDQRSWKGTISVAGRTVKGEATLECANEEIRVSGMKVKARRATLKVQSNGSTIECTSWLAKGFGIVKQEQRTNGALDVSLERVRGS